MRRTYLAPVVVALAACSGRPAPRATAIPSLTVTTPRPHTDEPLAAVPVGFEMGLHVDVPRLRALPVVGVLVDGMLHGHGLATLIAALQSACGFDPVARVASITAGVGVRDGRSSIVARGRFDPVDGVRCIGASTRVEVARVGARDGRTLYGAPGGSIATAEIALSPDAVVLAAPAVLIATLDAMDHHGASMAQDDDARAVLSAVGRAPVGVVVATSDALVAAGEPLGALTAHHPRAAALALHEHAVAEGIRLHAAARFGSETDAREAADAMGPAWQTMARAMLPAEALGPLDHVTFTARGTMVEADVALAAADLARLAQAMLDRVAHYQQASRSGEAVEHLAYIARAEEAYAQEPVHARARRGRFTPGAPRTPADVPRGAMVVDPPGTWSHATWRALDFEITDAHAFSYEVVSDGRSFTARAYGDLDGDGQLGTFERAGRLLPDGGVELAPIESHDADE